MATVTVAASAVVMVPAAVMVGYKAMEAMMARVLQEVMATEVAMTVVKVVGQKVEVAEDGTQDKGYAQGQAAQRSHLHPIARKK